MNKHLLTAFCLLFSITSKAQINGTDTVCPAYIYSFTATVAGADSFVWTYPAGWFVISGQGNDTVQLYCNQNIGNVCVDGYDVGGNLIAQYCNTVTWGGGGFGWNVQVQPLTPCQCPPSAILIQNNGSGGPCGGCGINGYGSTKTAYAIYDGPWPTGNLVNYAGINSVMGPPLNQTTYYVYYVDTILSQTAPFRISGGLCGGTINNTFDLFPCFFMPLPLVQTPDPACVGDVVTISVDPFMINQLGLTSYQWNTSFGYISLQGATNLSSVQAIKSSQLNNFNDVEIWAIDMFGCNWNGFAEIHVTNCLPNIITGDTTVCAGYTYNYTATISGAVSYTWTFPSGWYGITGQGSSNVSATCNVSDGNVCVEGFDALGNSLGTECLTTEFGGGGAAGWDVFPQASTKCVGLPTYFNIIPNGTGGGPGCPAGCGTGTLHPNLQYCVYDNVWPTGNWVAYADGSAFFTNGGVYYVYYCDVTNGNNPPQAIRIEGGCGSATINNTSTISSLQPLYPNVVQNPVNACIGDTVELTETTSLTNPCWSCTQINGLILLSPQFSNPATVIVTSTNPEIDITGIDANGCLTNSLHLVTMGICNAPTVAFASSDTIFCDKQSIDFFDFSTNNPTSWQWTFTGATPNSSTDQNPTGIYYPANGTFDVELIACNANGCDTLLMQNFITEFQAPSIPVITGNSGTMYCSGYNTYQWFLTGSGTVLSTDSFYVPTQQGSYFLIATDTNGCEIASNVFVITDLTPNPSLKERGISIVPNPNDGKFEIILNAAYQTTNVELRILNSVGQVVFNSQILPNQQAVTSNHSLITTQLETGIYFIEVKTGGNVFREKMVVRN